MNAPLPTDIDLARSPDDIEPGFWWDLLEHGYHCVMQNGDFKTGERSQHQLVCSPIVLRDLQMDMQWRTRVGSLLNNHPDGTVRLMGMFQPITYMPPTTWDELTPGNGRSDVVPMDYLFFYLRVERANGRFVYIDWSGNDEALI